ncbi:MAG: ribose-5-phosphate isomerase RpiA [Chloroflexota bacterium]
MSDIEVFKRQAAERALDYVQSNTRIGLGSGSTARHMLRGLAERLADGRLQNVVGVPTSEATAALAHQLGIPLTTLDDCPQLAYTLDGADEIDPQLNLIKGLGGALLREKIVASSAEQFFVLADSSKLVMQLGEHTGVPVEVIPFAQTLCSQRLSDLGGQPKLRQNDEGKPFYTDEGNIILDCHFVTMADPGALNVAIMAIPGVVDHGLFLGIATTAFIAGPTGVTLMTHTE